MSRRRQQWRRAQMYQRKLSKRQMKARIKIDRLNRKQAALKAKGKLAKADKVKRKIARVAARTGVSAKLAPGVRRKAPRYKYRIRKGQKQEWSLKYRGWVKVPSRRRRPFGRDGIQNQLDDIKQNIDTLRTIIGVAK